MTKFEMRCTLAIAVVFVVYVAILMWMRYDVG
jgi:hypothetical protein